MIPKGIPEITETALTIMKGRYIHDNEIGWEATCRRIAAHFTTHMLYKGTFTALEFQELIYSRKFLPSSPIIMNAGTDINFFSACCVLDVDDNMESIFRYYANAAKVFQSGGGVGCNFSSLRPAGASVGDTSGVASGPVSFMTIQDTATEVIKQGGKRKGANMGILDCDHPDILGFIKAKQTPGVLENFNLSVRLSDEFMHKYLGGIDSSRATEIFDTLCEAAHAKGEPGVIFENAMSDSQEFQYEGYPRRIRATNPCGEQPLLPFETCVLGSINLAAHLLEDKSVSTYDEESGEHLFNSSYSIDWGELKRTVQMSVVFLNSVLDKTVFPMPEMQDAAELTRKIGLGIMGLHDVLIYCGLSYDSIKGRQAASDIMKFISEKAAHYSKQLLSAGAGCRADRDLLNLNLITIAPTGTISTIAGCSSGCEPYFSPFYTRENVGEIFTMNSEPFQTYLEHQGLREQGDSRPLPPVFKDAQDITPQNHLLMQAALQEHVDSGISKTINMPADASLQDVKDAFISAYSLGLKGVTVYRDGCRGGQVLTTKPSEDDSQSQPEVAAQTRVLAPCEKVELPDKINAVRHRIKTKSGEKVYITVGVDSENNPMELFVKFPQEEEDSYWNTVARLVSLSLRCNVSLDDITKQLRKSSNSVSDNPARLARVLDEYKTSDCSVYSKQPCTFREGCKGFLIFTSGCVECSDCGGSNCGN